MLEMLHLAAVVAMWIVYPVLVYKTLGKITFAAVRSTTGVPVGVWGMAVLTLGYCVLTVWVFTSYLITYW